MSRQLAQIHARRERLLARAADEREALAREIATVEPAIRVLDRGLAAIEWMRRHPEPLIAVAIGFAVLRPRRALRWVLRGFSLWRGYRQLARFVAKARA